VCARARARAYVRVYIHIKQSVYRYIFKRKFYFI